MECFNGAGWFLWLQQLICFFFSFSGTIYALTYFFLCLPSSQKKWYKQLVAGLFYFSIAPNDFFYRFHFLSLMKVVWWFQNHDYGCWFAIFSSVLRCMSVKFRECVFECVAAAFCDWTFNLFPVFFFSLRYDACAAICCALINEIEANNVKVFVFLFGKFFFCYICL